MNTVTELEPGVYTSRSGGRGGGAFLLAVALLMFIVPALSRGAVVRIGYFNDYLPAEIEAHILEAIANGHPSLGVSHVDLIGTDVTPAWVGLQRGDTDVLVEVDLPNQQFLLDRSAGVATTVGEIYANAREGFYVPSYVVKGPHAPAPGLARVDQLGAYGPLFGDTLYDESPGWESTKDNAIRLKAFGIRFTHMELSDSVLIAMVTRAIQRHQPIVFFFYHPHWLFKRFALTELNEPIPYHPHCFTSGNGRCAVPSFSAWIGARKDLASRAPLWYRFLGEVKIPIGDIESMMFDVGVQKQPVGGVARRWVAAHRAQIAQWVAIATR